MRKLTVRERRSKKLSRQRAAKIWLRVQLRRVAAALLLTLLFSTWWAWRAHLIQDGWDHVRERAYAMTAEWGFVVRRVYLEGRDRAPLDAVQRALGVRYGDPILGFSLAQVRRSLESLDWIEQAIVERQHPDTLHIRIIERRPIALWQTKQSLWLVDRQGKVMRSEEIGRYSHLPILAGEDAPAHAYALIRALAAEPELFIRVSSAIRVGKRRWNIRLYNGVEIQLPEQGMAESWSRLAAMQRSDGVLDKEITAVDMRIDGRVFFRLTPAAAERRRAGQLSQRRLSREQALWLPSLSGRRSGLIPVSTHEMRRV